MGKASRNHQGSARAKIAAQRAAGQRRRRARRLWLAGGSTVAIVAIVAGLVVARTMQNSARPGTAVAQATGATQAAVTRQLAAVPASTLSSVGAGTASGLQPIQGHPALLTQDGKPEVLYIGAEWCPYCAAERWAMTVALDRFGSFSGLRFIHSSSTDSFPGTPTLSYYGSSYTSKSLAFSPVEMYTNVAPYRVLQTPTSAQYALFSKYDGPPYVAASQKLSYPFVDIANRYVLVGAQYLPSDLAGLTWSQIGAALKNPDSTVARDIDGAANILTAALSKVTGVKPAGGSAVSLASATRVS